jgi:hypothetical protein
MAVDSTCALEFAMIRGCPDSLDDQIVYPSPLQAVCDSLRHQHPRHDRDDVVECSSELHDNHRKRHGGTGHAGKSCRSANLQDQTDSIATPQPAQMWAQRTMAYIPGTTHWVSLHTLKIESCGAVHSSHSMPNPAMRPAHAPTTSEGMNIPAVVQYR